MGLPPRERLAGHELTCSLLIRWRPHSLPALSRANQFSATIPARLAFPLFNRGAAEPILPLPPQRSPSARGTNRPHNRAEFFSSTKVCGCAVPVLGSVRL